MKIEDQVCSLDLAKRLQELGVIQDSYFYWDYNVYTQEDFTYKIINENNLLSHRIDDVYSAFTVAELGEMLPSYYKKDKTAWLLGMAKSMKTNGFVVIYKESKRKESEIRRYDENEANARAKMLIYLIENKLIDVSEINK